MEKEIKKLVSDSIYQLPEINKKYKKDIDAGVKLGDDAIDTKRISKLSDINNKIQFQIACIQAFRRMQLYTTGHYRKQDLKVFGKITKYIIMLLQEKGYNKLSDKLTETKNEWINHTLWETIKKKQQLRKQETKKQTNKKQNKQQKKQQETISDKEKQLQQVVLQFTKAISEIINS